MALKSTITGEYHKIELDEVHGINYQIETSTILIRVFENEVHRTEVRNNSDEELLFKKSYLKRVMFSSNIIDILLDGSKDINLSTVNNFKTAVYLYLKTLPEYNNYVDC